MLLLKNFGVGVAIGMGVEKMWQKAGTDTNLDSNPDSHHLFKLCPVGISLVWL